MWSVLSSLVTFIVVLWLTCCAYIGVWLIGIAISARVEDFFAHHPRPRLIPVR